MSSSRKQKRALQEKLEHLRTITNSTAVISSTRTSYLFKSISLFLCWKIFSAQTNDASILIDASKYIEDLKKKAAKLNQDSNNSTSQISCSERDEPSTVKI